MVKRSRRKGSSRKGSTSSRKGSTESHWAYGWNPVTKRKILIPPGKSPKKKSRSRSRSGTRRSQSKNCCDQKSVLMRSVLRLSARLAGYRAKEMEEKAKKDKNQTKRVKAAQKRKEIRVLADAADATLKAMQRGEYENTYDKFVNRITVEKYGYSDKDFERVTAEILKGAVKVPNPPKPAVEAIKKVEKLVVNNPDATPMAKNVVNNVQHLVKRKVAL